MLETRENICIDFLSATFSYIEDNEGTLEKTKDNDYTTFHLMNARTLHLIDILGFTEADAFKEDYGVNGYKVCYTFGEYIKLQLGGSKNKEGNFTCQLLMSGEACRDFEKHNGDWQLLFYYLVNKLTANFTRIDIAFDLFHEDYFTLDQLINKVRKFEFTSYSHRVKYSESYERSGKCVEKQCYIGSLSSDCVVNIYDKNVQMHNAKDTDTWVNTWNRIELRYKKERATTVGHHLETYGLKDFAKYATNLLYTTLDIKRTTNDSNMRRRKTWQKWEKFVKNAEKIDITNQAKLESTIAMKKKYIASKAAKSLLMILVTAILGGSEQHFIEEINKYMLDKEEKINKKDLKAINTYLKDELGLAPMTMEELIEFIHEKCKITI